MQSLISWHVTVFFIVVCSRVLGAIFSSAVIDIDYAHATLSTAHTIEHVIDKASTDRLDHSVQCWADIIRELVMAREGLLVLSDSRISKYDVCAAIEHLCVE